MSHQANVFFGQDRDLNYPIARAERGSILQDARDAYIKEIGVAAGGAVSLKPGGWSEGELLPAQVGA